jgi:hypothetical protein
MTEDRGQMTDGSGQPFQSYRASEPQKSEVGDQRSEDRGQNCEFRIANLGFGM